MAIDFESVSNVSLNKPVSDISARTAPPLLDTEVEKVLPAQQVQPISRNDTSETQVALSIEKNDKSIDTMVSKLNEFVEQHKRDIRFSIDKDTNKTVVKLLDSNGDVLKQIPPEDVLAILKDIENNKGLFLKYEA